MSLFSIDIDCPHCAGDVEQITASPVKERMNREHATVLVCKDNAHHLWVVRIEMMKAPVDARAAELQRKHRAKVRQKEAA